MRSVSNFTSFLTRGTPEVTGLDPVDQRVLTSLQGTSGIPLADMAKATSVTPESLLPSIERLTASNRVEVVQYEEKGPRFLRLTTDGYMALKSFNV
jgi:hypothetical protein